MTCTSSGISTTVVHLPGDSIAPSIVEPVLCDHLSQRERGKYELALSNVIEVQLEAKPREISKGDVIAVQETLFNTTWYGMVKEVEYRLTIGDDATLHPAMNLTVARFVNDSN